MWWWSCSRRARSARIWDDTDRDPDEPPTKWTVYEQILRIPYYVVFSRYTDEVHYFELTGGQYREIQPAEPASVATRSGRRCVGLWFGTYQGLERQWLRCYDASGAWILTPHEQEQQRAASRQTNALSADSGLSKNANAPSRQYQRAERLAAQLRAWGSIQSSSA